MAKAQAQLTPLHPASAVSSAEDLCRLSATGLARRIARGEVTALQAVEAHIARIEHINQKLNAVVVKRYDAARAEARDIDARRARGELLPPLGGVPITVKECIDLAGTPLTFGLPSRAQAMAKTDDDYVARLRAAGAIVLGKTNVAQLLLFVETDNPIHGRTNNPWNLDRSSGGSSGGEGAIIAAGGSALGLGTDIGGSVRIPAAFCGITAMRPTAGRAPDLGRFSVPIGQRGLQSQIGPLARHVEDLALCLELMAGARDPQIEPPVPLGDFRNVDVAGLRVAVFTDDGLLTPAPAARRAVREAAEMLTKAGAKVTAWQPPAIETAWRICFWCIAGDKGRAMRQLLKGQKTDARLAILKLAGLPRLPLALMRGLLRAGGQRRMAYTLELLGANGETDRYWQTLERQFDYRQEWRRSLDSAAGGPFDVVLCPAFGVPAVRHGATQNLPLAGAYSVLPVVLGYPAGVVPVTRVRAEEETERSASRDIVERTARESEVGSAGLPVAVQVIARPWQEHVALAVMRSIEEAARSRPDYPDSPPI